MIVFDSACSDRHTTPTAAELCDNAPRRIDNRHVMFDLNGTGAFVIPAVRLHNTHCPPTTATPMTALGASIYDAWVVMMKHRPKCRLLLKTESHRRRHDTNACRKHHKKHMFWGCRCRRALSKISTHRKTQYCPVRPTWTCQKRKMIVFDNVCSDRHTTPMAAESCDNAPRRIDNRLAM